MYDFSDVRLATKDEQIRAYSVEKAIEVLVHAAPSGQEVVNVSKMIEEYIRNGDVTSTIQYAVEEGYREGRFEAKEAVEEWLSNDRLESGARINLDQLFEIKGWTVSRPSPGYIQEY